MPPESVESRLPDSVGILQTPAGGNMQIPRVSGIPAAAADCRTRSVFCSLPPAGICGFPSQRNPGGGRLPDPAGRGRRARPAEFQLHPLLELRLNFHCRYITRDFSRNPPPHTTLSECACCSVSGGAHHNARAAVPS